MSPSVSERSLVAWLIRYSLRKTVKVLFVEFFKKSTKRLRRHKTDQKCPPIQWVP